MATAHGGHAGAMADNAVARRAPATIKPKPRAITDVRVSDSDERRVLDALRDPQWDFYTINGLVSTTALPRAKVRAILKIKTDVVRTSLVPDRDGQQVYTLRSRPVKLRERVALFRLFIAKTYR